MRKYLSVYEVVDKGIDGLNKGDLDYLDGLHMDHLEVFDRRGKFREVLNLDGLKNETKIISGAGRDMRK